MRQVLSIILASAMLTHGAWGAAPETANVKTQIVGMSPGVKMELRLKNKQKMRGSRGSVSESGFTLVDAAKGNHEIAFDDVVSAKQYKSHVTRNVLICVGIGVGAVAITAAILLRCGPLGCGGFKGTLGGSTK